MGEANNGTGAPAAAAQNTPNQPADQTKPSAIPGAPGQAPGHQTGNPVKDAANAAARKFKFASDDGQEVEVDEDEVLKVYKERKGHQSEANKRFQEGMKARKQAEEFITAMRDPEKLVGTLQKMGWDKKQIREVAEKYLTGVLEDEMMDPKDKELKTTKQRLEEFERNEKARKDQEEREHHEKLKKKFSDDYSKDFIEALQTTKLPPTKVNVGKMAGYIARAAKIKMPMTANEAAKLVQQDIIQENRHLLKEMSPDQIIQLVGEDGLKKIRDYDVSRLKDPSANIRVPEEQGEITRPKKTDVKRMTSAEWRAFNRKAG